MANAEEGLDLNITLKRMLLGLYYADALEEGEEIQFSFMEDPLLQDYNMKAEMGFIKEMTTSEKVAEFCDRFVNTDD